MKTSIKLLALITLTGSVALTSCRKDEDPGPAPISDGTATILIDHMADTAEFALNTNYTDDFGTVYQISRAEFYITGINFLDDLGNSMFSSSNAYIIRPTVTEIDLGAPGMTHVHEIEFNVGVDSATNHLDPSTYAAGSALAPQVPGLHWGWSSGYIFVAIEGLADRNADGTPEAAFEFHLGTDAFLKTVGVHVHTDIVAGQVNYLDITIDYTKFFTGIDLSDPNASTHTMDNITLATQFMNNIDSVFTHSH